VDNNSTLEQYASIAVTEAATSAHMLGERDIGRRSRADSDRAGLGRIPVVASCAISVEASFVLNRWLTWRDRDARFWPTFRGARCTGCHGVNTAAPCMPALVRRARCSTTSSTLYLETDAWDGFREPGFSKERRLELQITIGLVTGQDRFSAHGQRAY
jgi:hypothetical protein